MTFKSLFYVWNLFVHFFILPKITSLCGNSGCLPFTLILLWSIWKVNGTSIFQQPNKKLKSLFEKVVLSFQLEILIYNLRQEHKGASVSGINWFLICTLILRYWLFTIYMENLPSLRLCWWVNKTSVRKSHLVYALFI